MATAVPIQMARVSASRTAADMMTPHRIHTQIRRRALAAKNRNDASMMSANISWPENVFQWLMKPVMRSPT